MDARLTRDGLLKLELRLDARQRARLYQRFDELRRRRGEPLSDHECLNLLVASRLVGPEGLLAEAEETGLV